jgi:4-hydroxybenzoate polyprenyltransferase
LVALLEGMRPRQWTKNLLVLAALLFAGEFTHGDAVRLALEAFALFCLLSGATYLVNDCLDLDKDRLDPIKSRRPLASGRLPVKVALVAAGIIFPLALLGAWQIDRGLFQVALAYTGLTLAYSGYFKHIVILDVFFVATGFVLRAIAGAVAIRAEISPWLIICTLLLALFLALAKRRAEITALGEDAIEHRAILAHYSPALLDQMISVVTASTLMSYCLYTISERTVQMVGSTDLLFTIPFVIYGIFRYLYLIHQKGAGGHPDRVLLSDGPLLATLALYVVTAALIVYVFH